MLVIFPLRWIRVHGGGLHRDCSTPGAMHFMPAQVRGGMIASGVLPCTRPALGQSLERQVVPDVAVGVVIGFPWRRCRVPMLRKDGFRFAWVNPFHDPACARWPGRWGPATPGGAWPTS